MTAETLPMEAIQDTTRMEAIQDPVPVRLSPTIWHEMQSRLEGTESVSLDSFRALCLPEGKENEDKVIKHADGTPLGEDKILAAFEGFQDAGLIAFEPSDDSGMFAVKARPLDVKKGGHHEEEGYIQEPFHLVRVENRHPGDRRKLRREQFWYDQHHAALRKLGSVATPVRVTLRVVNAPERAREEHAVQMAELEEANAYQEKRRAWQATRRTSLVLEYEPSEGLLFQRRIAIDQAGGEEAYLRLVQQGGGYRGDRAPGDSETEPENRFIPPEILATIDEQYHELFTNDNVRNLSRDIGSAIRQKINGGKAYDQAKLEAQEEVVNRVVPHGTPELVRQALIEAQETAIIEARSRRTGRAPRRPSSPAAAATGDTDTAAAA